MSSRLALLTSMTFVPPARERGMLNSATSGSSDGGGGHSTFCAGKRRRFTASSLAILMRRSEPLEGRWF
jgi:hypothetical protein